MNRLIKLADGLIVDLLRGRTFTGQVAADFPAEAYRVDGVRRTAAEVVSFAAALERTAGGGVAVSRATSNGFAGRDMTGAVVGLHGAGGSLPTGWIPANSGIAVEVLAFDGRSITLRFTRGTSTESAFGVRNVNPAAGGQPYPEASRGGVATSATIEILHATPNIDAVIFSVSRLDGTTTIATTSAMRLVRGEPPRRLTVWEPAADITGRSASVRFGGLVAGDNPTSAPYSVTVRLSELMMEDAAAAADATPWTATSRPAQQLTLSAPDGGYDILAIGGGWPNHPAGGQWLPGTAAGGVLALPARSGPAGEALPADLRVVHAYPGGMGRAEKEACHQVVDRLRLIDNPGTDARVQRGGVEYASQNSQRSYTWRPAANRRNYDRFEARGDDHWTSPDDNRTEFSGHAWRAPFDTDIWCAYSLLLEPGDPQPSGDHWCLLGQWHATEDPGDLFLSPVWACTLMPGDELRIVTRSDPSPTNTVNPDSVIRGVVPRLARGRWHRFVHRIRFCRTGATGAAQTWLNEVEVMNAENIPVGYNDVTGPYWKYGIYRRTVEITTAVRYANMELGTASLLDRVANPRVIS